MFTSVVSLLVCADIYAQGMQKNRRGGLPVGDGAERGLWLCQHDRGDDAAGRYNRCTDGLRGCGIFSLSPAWRLLSPLNLAKALYI